MIEEEKKHSRVSYSQYGMFSTCKEQYKLQYIDKLGKISSNIHLIFGTAVHETIQEFLKVMYNESKVAALKIDLDDMLLKNMIASFNIEKENMKGVPPCTREEMEEFYGDGRRILQYFKGKLTKFYPKSGYELVGIEIPLEIEVKNGVKFIGYIDVVLKDKISGKIIIIDLKTSTKGWSKYQKNDKVKTSQMLLYKKFYSELFGVPMDDITVEYQIFKRKVEQPAEYHIPRISKFIPPNGKPSINKAYKGFKEFVDFVFDENGKRQPNGYEPTTGRHCDWCDYKLNGHCSAWK